jgi:hypothetical protein
VFEHLHNPLIAVKNTFDMTVPGGYLIWAAPNIEVKPSSYFDWPNICVFFDVVIIVISCAVIEIVYSILWNASDLPRKSW